MKQMIKILLFFLFPFLILSCGQISGKDQGDATTQTKYGNVSAQIIWPQEGAKRKTGDNLTALQAAMPSTIVTINMTVSGGGMTPVSKDFNASDGRGVLPGVAIGDRILTCQGKNSSGKVLYSGSSIAAVIEGGNVNVKVEMEYVGNDSLLKGLVAYYPFNGNADDESGNGNDGLLKGGTYSVSDMPPVPDNTTSLSLLGDNDLVEIPNGNEFNFNSQTPMSLSIWVKQSTFRATFHVLGKRSSCSGGKDYNYQMARDASGFGFLGNATGDIPLQTWTHVTGTFDGDSAKLYVNGVLMGTKSNFTFNPTNSATVLIGNSGKCPSHQGFPGLVDEVRIYNRALSETEIKSLYTPAPSTFTSRGAIQKSYNPRYQ